MRHATPPSARPPFRRASGFLERRIAPVALVVDGYLSLATGPQNYHHSYIVGGSTERLNTFWLTGVLAKTHVLHFASSAPKKLRLHLRDVSASDWLIVQVSYNRMPNRVDVYNGGRKIAAVADVGAVDASQLSGTSFFDQSTSTLHVHIKGYDAIDLVQTNASA